MNLRKVLMFAIPVIVLGIAMLSFNPLHHVNLAQSVQAASGSNCFGGCTPVPSGPTCLDGGAMPTGLVPFGYEDSPASGTAAGMEVFGRSGCKLAISLLDFEVLVVNQPVGVTVYDVTGSSGCNTTPVRTLFRGFLNGTSSKQSDRITIGNANTPIMWANAGDSICFEFDAPVAGSESVFAYTTFI